MPIATVCGLRVRIGKVTSYGGGHIYPGARDIGRYAPVGKTTAKKLVLHSEAGSVHRFGALPRPGYEVKLCESTYLGNKAGRFEVERRASGDFHGAKRRKKRRR